MAIQRSIGVCRQDMEKAAETIGHDLGTAAVDFAVSKSVTYGHTAFTKADWSWMQPDYLAYTTKFDREVRANDLDPVLGPLGPRDRAAVEEAWHELQTGLLPWRTRQHIAAANAAGRLRELLTDEERADTAVTLLLDQSGSMRGQKMLFAAATVDIVQEFLLTLGFTCEVLGFTTSAWRGGRSRRRWKWRFRPGHPGRLNDILHVIYKSADDRRASTGGWDFRHMLRPDLPKENIDGEAILWAAKRLLSQPQSQKHLIVLSDGAPVDDSTLLENGLTYLTDHLQIVVERIAEARQINLAAIGIGPEFHDLYPVSSQVDAPDDLCGALISLLERVLVSKEAAPKALQV
jgi:cobaltochelatase CobT subunit